MPLYAVLILKGELQSQTTKINGKFTRIDKGIWMRPHLLATIYPSSCKRNKSLAMLFLLCIQQCHIFLPVWQICKVPRMEATIKCHMAGSRFWLYWKELYPLSLNIIARPFLLISLGTKTFFQFTVSLFVFCQIQHNFVSWKCEWT